MQVLGLVVQGFISLVTFVFGWPLVCSVRKQLCASVVSKWKSLFLGNTECCLAFVCFWHRRLDSQFYTLWCVYLAWYHQPAGDLILLLWCVYLPWYHQTSAVMCVPSLVPPDPNPVCSKETMSLPLVNAYTHSFCPWWIHVNVPLALDEYMYIFLLLRLQFFDVCWHCYYFLYALSSSHTACTYRVVLSLIVLCCFVCFVLCPQPWWSSTAMTSEFHREEN